MDWKSVSKKLLNIGAPILGTALAGPPGGLAAKVAISAIAKKFGIKEKNIEDIQPETVDALVEDSNLQLQFRELEIQEKIELQRLINEETKMHLEDKGDARSREVEITKATGKRDINLYIIAYLFISGFFLLTGYVLYLLIGQKLPSDIPQGATMLLGLLIGTMNAGVVAIVQYFFGSSKSSKQKTDIMAMMGNLKG